jgi:subfamily B ATP-binding cassette protein MsbA
VAPGQANALPAAVKAGTNDRYIAVAVRRQLENEHFLRKPIDDEIARRWFSSFLEALDPMKVYFLQSDVDAFMQKRESLDDLVKKGDVTFAYDDAPVLHNVSLTIPAGQVVALVGPSGAGKSTFAQLVPRFYDAREGEVRIDGISVRDFKKHDLRAHIAVVPQMPSLFLGTLEENIRVGKQDATRAEIEAAAKKAFAHDFITAMPQGYDTPVGERGDLLSGGQRQRIAIARAFLKDAPILILDEATSALDTESEAAVQQALAELVKGRTTLIIAHRFSTIRIADRILVFRDGRVVSDGSHEELRDLDPTYQAMVGGELR